MSTVDKARFKRELGILSGKVQHRAIVTLFDWSTDVDQLWYISEFGDPFSRWWSRLRKDLEEDPASLVDKAVSVLFELASALSVCHGEGVIHRDIKPKNLIVKRGVAEPWPILIDFGLAHAGNESRLTQVDQAVGNKRFSPDIMRYHLEEIQPWLDVFELAQLFIWMLDEKSPKDHWQRPVHWKYAEYSDRIPKDLQLSIRAFTAACSSQDTSPADATEAVTLLRDLFTPRLESVPSGIDVNSIAVAKRRGEAKKHLREAETQEEVQSSAPLAEKYISI